MLSTFLVTNFGFLNTVKERNKEGEERRDGGNEKRRRMDGDVCREWRERIKKRETKGGWERERGKERRSETRGGIMVEFFWCEKIKKQREREKRSERGDLERK